MNDFVAKLLKRSKTKMIGIYQRYFFYLQLWLPACVDSDKSVQCEKPVGQLQGAYRHLFLAIVSNLIIVNALSCLC